MKKVLVTGGGGYVGSVLVGKLLSKNYQVNVLDLFIYDKESLGRYENNECLEIILGDIRDSIAVEKAMQNVDAVIHLAAISNDPTAEMDSELTKTVNYDAYNILLKSAKNNNVKRFINASSSSVFGIKSETDVTEDLKPEPITLYSKYKALSEKLVNAASSKDFVTVNIRPATICGYSHRQRFDLTVNTLTKNAIRDGQMIVHGGEQMRPNVTIEDITDLYIHMLEIDGDLINGDTFNFGFENLKVIEIARKIQSTLNVESRIEIQPIIDKRNYHISSQKIIQKLGIEPRYKIADMIMQLESSFERKEFLNTEHIKYYNIKKMKLEHFA